MHMRGKRKTTKDFIKEAQEIHGNRYSYGKAKYNGAGLKVRIHCKKHGFFLQTPHRHLKGSGCHLCGRLVPRRRPSQLCTEVFIKRAKKLHGNTYSYKRTVYETALKKIWIFCPLHGYFRQTPAQHLAGRGCNKCKYLGFRDRLGIPRSRFLNLARNVHKSSFKYIKLNKHILRKDLLSIKCIKHGFFKQRVENHIYRKQGCPKCSDALRGLAQRKKTSSFVRDARSTHGRKYTYDETVYSTATKKVRITCKRHGIFLQTPASHLFGAGCPSCKESKGEAAIAKCLSEKNIQFFRQWTHNTLVHKRLLKFDFFLPKFKILIEFDGIQHYKPVNWAPKKKRFVLLKQLKLRDQLKTVWARRNGFLLKRFNYKSSLPDDLNIFLKDFSE